MLAVSIKLLFGLVLMVVGANAAGILYPKPSLTREIYSLNGMWNFTLLRPDPSKSLDHRYSAVPASYNDQSPEYAVRDHVGSVWYYRTFFPPRVWNNHKIWIRFSSVSYSARVLINGREVISHSVGHLPFQADITADLNLGVENNITVEVNNMLNAFTVPQGTLQRLASNRTRQNTYIDYFNYAGIDRPVVLYATPKVHIDDITVTTTVDGTTGVINYQIVQNGTATTTTSVTLLDKKGNTVVTGSGLTGTLRVPNANLWWPNLMSPDPGYLYTLRVELLSGQQVLDQYFEQVGIRTLTWTANSLSINGKPLYLRGFGRHDDSEFRGRGLDIPTLVRDYNLIRWIGANAIRTAHYPLSEEEMDLADRWGIVVINEAPSDQTGPFSQLLKTNHIRVLTEMHQRDKNRPSTVIWSIANEPQSQLAEADVYFK